MPKKGRSFAQKAARGVKKKELFTMVKYVKSVKSTKTGSYRFQETMLKIPIGMSLDAYLKKQKEKDHIEGDVDTVTEGEVTTTTTESSS